MSNHTYLKLCTQVYDLSKPTPPDEAYAFYRSYVKTASGPILEPMCGSGRFLLPLLKEGFDVHGFDASPDMLHALHQKADTQKLKINVWQGLIQDLKRPERYALMFIPTGSFGLIIEHDQIKRSLKVLFEHLKENGILLFEVETLKAVPTPTGVWRGSVWNLSNEQMILANYCSSVSDDLCTAIGRYELVAHNKIIETEIEEYKIRLYSDETILTNILHEIGFKHVRVVKAFDKNKCPDTEDEVLIYECVK